MASSEPGETFFCRFSNRSAAFSRFAKNREIDRLSSDDNGKRHDNNFDGKKERSRNNGCEEDGSPDRDRTTQAQFRPPEAAKPKGL